jgi:hypothetical protein
MVRPVPTQRSAGVVSTSSTSPVVGFIRFARPGSACDFIITIPPNPFV